MEKLKEFAKKLTERCSYREVPADLSKQAKELGIVIVYGASDDLMELEGAISDEFDCFDGGTAYLNENGLFVNECENDECPYMLEALKKCKCIHAVWCDKDNGWIWSYEIDIPHETFEMMEDGEKYCQGIVFYRNALK